MPNAFENCTPSKVKAYMGLRRPACHGGIGCCACQAKYDSKEAQDLRLRRAYGGRYA